MDRAAYIASFALEALLVEAAATPKPGLVDRANCGAHADMDFFTFQVSAAAIAPFLSVFVRTGTEHTGDASALLARLRPVGMEAERAMFARTGGVNTHKGAIFSFGVLLGAAGLALRRDEKCTAAHVLDLFAGTGALGLEALSRGAASALFVDERTASLIEENAAKTRLLERAEVVRADVLRILTRLGGAGRSFDLIFCDPPYRQGLWEKVLSSVDREGLLAPGGCMIVEHGAEEEALPALENLRCVREERYGKTTRLRFFGVAGEDRGGESR